MMCELETQFNCRRLSTVLILAASVMCLILGAVVQTAWSQDDAGTQGVASKEELRQRFGEQQFSPPGGFLLRQGQRLPALVWEQPKLVAQVVTEIAIPTRWFNDRFEEVTIAERPGRYYVYGEAPVPDGPVLRRAMTCCCLGDDQDVASLAEKWLRSNPTSPDAEPIREVIGELVKRWQSTEEGAVELAAWLETGQPIRSLRGGQWQMEDATRHVRLKRKLMGFDQLPVEVQATPLEGKPAAALRMGRLEEAQISDARVREIEGKLDQWYAASGEPMAIVIARNGVVVSAKAYGDVDDQQVTINTPMRLDSAMKPLIGLQLAMYVDRDILRLDEPIGNHLPDFNMPSDHNLTFRAGHVHATGIHFPWDLAFSRLFYFHTWHESLIAHCRREWSPGTQYRYGVVGVILSVRALELLRGRNYWDAMERDLFQPLEIDDMLPGGTGFSAEDMARIGVLLANHGKYGKWQLFSEATYQQIIPVPLQPYFPDLKMKYGIGLQDKSGVLGSGSYGHGGGGGTQLIVNPNKHLVFAMVRHNPGPSYREHLSAVTDALRAWIEE